MNVWELLDRPIAVHRPLVSLGVGITGAVLLSQALYWTRRTTDPNGWFYKTMEEWEEETGLTRSEQATARKRLREACLMVERFAGVPARLYFRVETGLLSQKLMQLLSESPHASARDSGMQGCSNPATLLAGSQLTKAAGKLQPRVKAETTAETTSETTATGIGPLKRATRRSTPKLLSPLGPIVVTSPAGRLFELPGDLRYPRDDTVKSFKTWANYAYCMHKRYGTWPVFNARQAKLCTTIVDNVGADVAPKLVAFYVSYEGDSFVLKSCHPLSILSTQAETWLMKAQSAKAAQSDGVARAAANLSAVGDSVSDAITLRRQRNAQ